MRMHENEKRCLSIYSTNNSHKTLEILCFRTSPTILDKKQSEATAKKQEMNSI